MKTSEVSQKPDLLKTTPLLEQVDNLESLLNQLMSDLGHVSPKRPHLDFAELLENFRMKSTIIRQVFDRFQNAEIPTRRYLSEQLDEEFENMRLAYLEMREKFVGHSH